MTGFSSIRSAAAFGLLAGGLLVPAAASAQTTPVEGAWVVTEWHSPDGEAMENTQPGLFVFTKTHYSVMFVLGGEPRAGYEEEMSDEQIIEAYGSFVANSGRYEVEGDRITTRAYVAKDPNYMNGWPENQQTYEFRIDDEGMLHLSFGGGPGAGMTAVARPVDDLPPPGSD